MDYSTKDVSDAERRKGRGEKLRGCFELVSLPAHKETASLEHLRKVRLLLLALAPSSSVSGAWLPFQLLRSCIITLTLRL
jgi:hypothetical protein